jgi:YD repeat-containing protein
LRSESHLTRAREGSWVSGSLGTFTHDEQWTLGQTGNWASRLLDLNGDSDGLDANEFTDAGTFNTANELTQRSLTGGVTATYTRTYDAVGNLTNDGKDYKFEYDAFGRMVRVRNRSTDALVAEYTYSGLGFRTSWKYDADASGTVDRSDPVYWFTHDERRRARV